MFARLNRKVRGGDGFTLIELLVVIIIIAILAAIAIPMYLSQRTKGWEATVQSDLRNAAVAQESYYTGPGNTYANTVVLLEGQGYNKSANIVMNDPVAGKDGSITTSYCLQANHSSGGRTFHFYSDEGNPVEGACVVAP